MHNIKNEDLYRTLLPGSEKYNGIGNITIEDSGDHIIITCTIPKKDLVTVVSTVASPNTPLTAPSTILSSSFGELKRIEWRESK